METLTATITKSSSYVPDRTEVWYNFGPLTTSFTPPAHCMTDPAKEGLVKFLITSGTAITTSFDCGQANLYYIQYPECYPSSNGMSLIQTATAGGGFWSPGVVCPSGWSTAYSWSYPARYSASLGAVENLWIGNPNLPVTLAKCCPRYLKQLCSGMFRSDLWQWFLRSRWTLCASSHHFDIRRYVCLRY